MKKNYIAFLFFCILFQPFLKAQEDFKIVGYFPYYRFDYADQIEFDKLTHVNISFANPINNQGTLEVGGEDIDPITTMAHNAGAEVFVALAGGALTSTWASAWEYLQKPPNRPNFIHKIINYCYDHDLDGIDVDLEWSGVGDNYSGFVIELSDSLHAHGFQISAALPGTHRFPTITDEALEAFDFINMMAYNLTGPWDPDNPGAHSPYSFAVSSKSYWVAQGIPTDKLTLGVPFYGYNFDGSDVSSFTYRTIVAEDPNNAYRDQDGTSYYNGIPTIRNKTTFAMNQSLAGIMIWEIGQDSYDEYSLLTTIYNTVNGIAAAEDVSNFAISVFPNPTIDHLWVAGDWTGDTSINVFDNHGQLLFSKTASGDKIRIDLLNYPAGLYYLQVVNEAEVETVRVLKG